MKMTLELEGLLQNVNVQRIGTQYWFQVDGTTFVIEEESSRGGGKKRGKGGSGELLAPMPGKITKLTKSVGEPVNQDEVVLVMEAMKMEYSLKADQSGIIESIQCKVGDQVALGKLLCKIKKDGEA